MIFLWLGVSLLFSASAFLTGFGIRSTIEAFLFFILGFVLVALSEIFSALIGRIWRTKGFYEKYYWTHDLGSLLLFILLVIIYRLFGLEMSGFPFLAYTWPVFFGCFVGATIFYFFLKQRQPSHASEYMPAARERREIDEGSESYDPFEEEE